jgi:hypothetical protein
MKMGNGPTTSDRAANEVQTLMVGTSVLETNCKNEYSLVLQQSGEELAQGDKFTVLVKKVDQYFTVQEKKKRVTVFENNYNVTRFFFEVPLTKDSQKSAILCWTRKTIITLPHPFPYIVSRVQVPKGNLEKTVFSPIELACRSSRSRPT